METEKIRNLSADEIRQQERQAAEQLFRLRFQMKLGQNEGVKKLRELRKDIARIKTIARERELSIRGAASEVDSGPVVTPARKSRKRKPNRNAKKAIRAVRARKPRKTRLTKPARKGTR